MADDENNGSHVSPSHSASFATTTTTTGRRPSPPTGNGHAPPGFGMRRAVTIDEGPQMRRRRRGNMDPNPNPAPAPVTPMLADEGGLLAGIRRGSSSFSDFNLGDARRDLGASAEDLLNPSGGNRTQSHTRQATSYLPLVFALLPAVAGVFFQNGASFFTDLILLSLAAVFLHWSVTQPWDWYHETQQVCVVDLEEAVLGESDPDSDGGPERCATPPGATTLEDIDEDPDHAEERTGQEKPNGVTPEKRSSQPRSRDVQRSANEARRAAAAEAAARELRMHEMMALAWCFVFPALSSYLLHTIRGQLSRPSEGLVSDYNLTIFLFAAELRPISHLISMVRARTLRMQRLVANANPYASPAAAEDLRALSARLNDLEARTATFLDPEEDDYENDKNAEHLNASPTSPTSSSTPNPNRRNSKPSLQQHQQQQQIAAATTAAQEVVAGTMQPELEALNRAMRRYEKKLAQLATQTDARLEFLDHRVHDAVALAATTGPAGGSDSNNKSRSSGNPLIFALSLVALPLRAALAVLTAPFRAAAAALRLLLGGSSSSSLPPASAPETAASRRRLRPRPQAAPRATTSATAAAGGIRSGGGRDRTGIAQSRDLSDRVPGRLSRR